MWPFWILGATTLLSGLITGVYYSSKKIYGYTDAFLFGDIEKELDVSRLPLFIMRTGICSIIGWGISSEFFTSGRTEIVLIFGIGIGMLIAFGYDLVVKKIEALRKMNCGLIGAMIGTLAGAIGGVMLGELSGFFLGAFAGALIGGASGAKIGEIPANKTRGRVSSEIAAGIMLSGVICGLWFGILVLIEIAQGETLELFLVWIGMTIAISIAGGFIGGFFVTVRIIALMIGWIVFFAMSPLLILLRFKTIICSNCLRYTERLHARYETGIRYCEHCRQEVEWTHNPGKVIFTFGDFPLEADDRVFIVPSDFAFGNAQPETESGIFFRSKFDIEHREQPIDVSEVYIDTKTADPRLPERFITFMVNYPPKHGLRSVQIFYRGKLDDLGNNLKNALRNNCEDVKQI